MEASILWTRFKDLFRLDRDLDREGTLVAIRDGVVFSGTNLWSLILAIFVASIGLNLNSPAVIVGAMLISPLMGPITGAGLALGIYDTVLLKRSLANLALMTALSLAVSTLYFGLSPLDEATAEILARTTPTFYDVLIAALGGSALMVGLSRKNKSSNILAGVAIATALMPPLCTAGFGLATRDLSIFAGAFYLYLINSVFIGMVTYLFSKFLRLHNAPEPEVDQAKYRRRHLALTVTAVVLFVTPSFFVAYDVVKESGWRTKVAQFQGANLVFRDSQVVSTKVIGQGDHRVLEVVLVGEPLSEDLKAHLTEQLPAYGLGDLTLKFVQPSAAKASQVPGTEAPRVEDRLPAVTREVGILFPSVANLAWGQLQSQGVGVPEPENVPTAFVRWHVDPPITERERLATFLRLRLDQPSLNVIHETLRPQEESPRD